MMVPMMTYALIGGMMNKLLTVNEVAERLKVTPLTVRRWLNAEKIAGVQLGDRAGWRIDEKDLEAFLAERRTGKEKRKATA